MHQNEAASLFSYIVGRPKLCKAYCVALFHYFKRLSIALVLLFLNYIAIFLCYDGITYFNYYFNLVRNTSFIVANIIILLIQMMEFRLKYLTVSFTLTLTFYLFVCVHLPELVALLIYIRAPSKILLATIHKLIEVIPLTLLSSSLLLNWKKTCFQSYLTLIIHNSSLVTSIVLSEPHSFRQNTPYLGVVILAFFPFAFSTEVAKLLVIEGQPDYLSAAA